MSSSVIADWGLNMCRNLQGRVVRVNARIGTWTERVNNGGNASSPSFGNQLLPAMPKSALPMRRTAKTPLIWLSKLHQAADYKRLPASECN